ncbi:hypothetical protein EB233_03325 [Mesorhizobium erdmanii]|uniref:Uncharacterized protein n=1 Tax=Mesorhizobium erdmanii TaxID=1777866 RepID=A0A6M7UG66_9HYPH|nr:hypothetical protein EB233_03325 [Mesorhizobium erdmanii]
MQKTPGLAARSFFARSRLSGVDWRSFPKPLPANGSSVLTQFPRASATRLSRKNRFTLVLELLSARRRLHPPARPAC